MITDTTMRDAHQSLLATRVRSYDLNQIADAYSYLTPNMFSLEMWGGATFDTTMRFLQECPWERLTVLREKVPNILFQMLLRASNAVGYTNYPDNVVKLFVKEAADAGIDVFRVFDALNWVPNMKVAMEAVRETGAICEASICYTGDILDPRRTKYDLKYYVELARELEKMGANILAIKDMAGLCKPDAAEILVKTLKQEIGIPIHFHTHDTAGIQAASILRASEVDLDIADAAMAPLSGGTSQVNLNTLCEALRFSERSTELKTEAIDAIADYWRSAREFYTPFESEVLPATADLYDHEMPGGQYTNLYQQARALGLADQWAKVCRVYAGVNRLFGDIVKVTPTSKAVGDMALFMVANNLTNEDVLSGEKELSYPQSVIDLIGGGMGQPPGGFPDEVKKRILKGEKGFTGRPGETLEPADFSKAATEVEKFLGRTPTERDVVTYILYPKVYKDFITHQKKYSNVSNLPTPVFFYGLDSNDEFSVDIDKGKTLIIKFVSVGEPHADGSRSVFFELNGQPRAVSVADLSLESESTKAIKADPNNPEHVGAAMPGMVVSIPVKEGDWVEKGDKLLSLEAMKMETNITAEKDGRVKVILVKTGSQVDTGDLLMEIEF
ncbi:MAG: pyruvate carboxylase subunit B [Planctomycetaceae bacterium]